jgi:hypothetical protein
MVINVLAAIGGLAVLLLLLDLTDFLLVRAGKRPLPGWRPILSGVPTLATAKIPDINRAEPRQEPGRTLHGRGALDAMFAAAGVRPMCDSERS